MLQLLSLKLASEKSVRISAELHCSEHLMCPLLKSSHPWATSTQIWQDLLFWSFVEVGQLFKVAHFERPDQNMSSEELITLESLGL